MKSFIHTRNPFGLADPPDSFLRDLALYDAQLVIFPSQAEPVYRLARRVSGRVPWERFSRGHLDNPVCHQHRLVPVKAISGFRPAWGQVIIQALASCDVQRVGGGVAAAELLDQQDELEERRLNLAIADEASGLAGEAYRSLKFHEGSTVALGVRQPEGAGAYGQRRKLATPQGRRRPVYRPRASGDHAMFVGR